MYMSPLTPCIDIPISCIGLPCIPMFIFGIDRLIDIEFRPAGLAAPFCIMKRMSGVPCCWAWPLVLGTSSCACCCMPWDCFMGDGCIIAKLSSSSISASASWSLVSSTEGGAVLLLDVVACSLACSFVLVTDNRFSCWLWLCCDACCDCADFGGSGVPCDCEGLAGLPGAGL